MSNVIKTKDKISKLVKRQIDIEKEKSEINKEIKELYKNCMHKYEYVHGYRYNYEECVYCGLVSK